MKILFDLRSDPDNSVVRVANEHLAAAGEGYFERYGEVGSEQWWEHYNRRHICSLDLVGEITHAGATKDDFGEACDVVRIRTDRGIIEYDREGFWLDTDVQSGRWVHIEQVEVCVATRTGPIRGIIDVRVWLEDEH